MRSAIRNVLWFAACVRIVCWQPGPNAAFEAASVKPSPPPAGKFAPSRMQGGPGTADPTRIAYRNMPMSMLVFEAYDIDRADVTGPEWATSTTVDYTSYADKFDVVATLPAGTSREQFRLMMQNLLAERFALRVHRERKEVPAYALVPAKNGPKLKESPPAPAGASTDDVKVSVRGEDGFPVTPPGYSGIFANVPGHTRVKFIGYSMGDLARGTRVNSNRPGVNRTGLTGRYDFYLEFGNDIASADQGEDFSTALKTQLGLMLESDNTEIEQLVIDHIDRTPSGN